MRTMVAQNPIHGLWEYLPFDQAVRKGKDLLGGNGYLANEEYRQFKTNGAELPKILSVLFPGVGRARMGKLLLKLEVEKLPPKMFGNYTYFLASRNCHYPSWNGS